MGKEFINVPLVFLALVTNGLFLVFFGNETLLLFTLVPPRPFLVLAHVRNDNISAVFYSNQEGLLTTQDPSYEEE